MYFQFRKQDNETDKNYGNHFDLHPSGAAFWVEKTLLLAAWMFIWEKLHTSVKWG